MTDIEAQLLVPPDLEARVRNHAARLHVAPADFMLEAIAWACDREEQPHVPKHVTEAQPRLLSSGAMKLPPGVVPTGLV